MPPKVTTSASVPTPNSVVRRSVWAGPCDSGPNGGVTVSLLQKFLSCRARFRAYVVEGWRAAPAFNHKVFYGSLWHEAERAFAARPDSFVALDAAHEYAEQIAALHPESREDIRKWWNVCRVQFPEYVKFWSSQSPTVANTPLLQEQVFDVPYRLPSGRVVRLRGRWDGVTRHPDGSMWLFETKTKGDVDALQVEKQLTFDLQTMTYLVALRQQFQQESVNGVRYNVVRRPLSGGKGTIVRHKPTKSNPLGESENDYYDRLRKYIRDEPATYFYRWTVDVLLEDVKAFQREFLDPCLEFLCFWYDTQTVSDRVISAPGNVLHWRTPYGLTNQVADGYGSDLDRYITTGSTLGLVRTQDLFPELK